MSNQTRRSFLRKLLLASEDTTASAGSHTLVCIFLRGGADTLNMIVPYGDDRYYAMRPNIAIKAPGNQANASVRLTDMYAFHGNLGKLKPLFDEGRLGIVQSVGSDNPSGSHFDAQDQMEHGEAYRKPLTGGWLGRHLRIVAHQSDAPLSAIAIGPAIPESLRGAPNVSAISSLNEIKLESPAHDPQTVANVLSKLYGAEVGILSNPGRSTLSLLKRVENLRDTNFTSAEHADYPSTDFGKGLREIARLIKANVGLEIACIDLGNWDTHFFQGSETGQQAELIAQLADGVAAFEKDLKPQRDRVTTVIMTEFGRRVYENSSLGTDHGRGFAMMALGPTVNGGTVHGAWPGLENEVHDLLGPAGLPINFDYRSVLAELLEGVAGNRHINAVFPDFRPQSVGLIKGLTVPIAEDLHEGCDGCRGSRLT